jgi:adenine-specific DNA-methyltransferase
VSRIIKESRKINDEYQKWLQEKFPSCFVEGKLDFKKLKELTSEITDNSNDEKYTFSWAGRNDSIKILKTTSKGTLLPVKDESINFDDTENIFIEGENLEVLNQDDLH